MDGTNKANKPDDDEDSLERFELPIVAIALVLYVIDRCLAFAFLQSRSGSASALESQVLGFFFGPPPYSILDILLGFDLNQGLFGLVQPRNFILVMIQIALFWVNYWIVRFPFMALTRVGKHKAD
jgi:hypothetical protein